jgi:hypothetical protein
MTRNCRSTLVSVSAAEAEAPVDTSVIEHLDADWALQCDGVKDLPESCQRRNRADYIVRLVACCAKTVGVTRLWCQTCLDGLRTQPRCMCNHCGREFTPASSAIRKVEPLNRRPQ